MTRQRQNREQAVGQIAHEVDQAESSADACDLHRQYSIECCYMADSLSILGSAERLYVYGVNECKE
jgi:hypothetical protein